MRMNKHLFERVAKFRQEAPEQFETVFPALPEVENEPNMVFNYAYNGKFFEGNAFLLDSPFTVEYEILKVLIMLKYILGVPHHFDRAGRTDAGVSSIDNYIVIYCHRKEVSLTKINNALPACIYVKAVYAIEGVNLRFSCKSREYFYKMRNRAITEASYRACQLMVGTHNFSNLSREDGMAVRTIYECQLVVNSFDQHIMQIKGQAFCRNEIRCIVGAVSDDPERMAEYLSEPKVERRYEIASPYELCLVQCEYDTSTWKLVGAVSENDINEFLSKNDLEWTVAPFRAVKEDIM